MREVTVPGLEIAVPKGSAFACETPKMMPKAHFLCAVIAPRGYGKGLITTAFLEKLAVIDRLIVVSPSALSNKALLDRLKKMLKPEDIHSDVNDITVIDRIIASVDKERDDLEEYLEKKKRYDRLMKGLRNESPMFRVSDDDLLASFDGNRFKPPEHKWGGRRPCICVWFDDIFGSQLMLGRGARKISELCIKHRHMGQLREGGALGCSLIFNMQAYKSAQGGLPKALRGNLTLLMLGRMKSEKDLDAVADEVAGEVDRDTFYRVFAQATDRPHSFLVIDMHPKKDHPSQFRRGLDTFIVVPDS
jgi:hypothetical protein